MTVIVSEQQMKSEFVRILTKYGFDHEAADQCAEIFTINTLEGVYSHGINRFPRFVENIASGFVVPGALPSLITASASVEQWNGNLGPGPLNASFAVLRAMELASVNGIGLVALSNTNHWMRGGTYGWQAARKGFVFIGWTNTEANMPAWGAKDYRLGNNPLVFAIPYLDEAIVLDFAMSQFSYGKLEVYTLAGKSLPYPGGYDTEGVLTTSPGDILKTRRALPIGYWKGSGLSLLLDILAAILSGGLSTHEISRKETEYSLSQVFIALDMRKLHNYNSIENTIRNILTDLKGSLPVDPEAEIRYPGEFIKIIRKENRKNGVPVNSIIWEKILTL